MKGTYFQKPFEFRLLVDGEAWQQGDKVSGSLVVKNHGAQVVELTKISVHLTTGELKKVRQKSSDAFERIESIELPAGTLAPGAECSLSWKFATDLNSPITDTSLSPFIVYGQGEGFEKLGQLQLPFRPAWASEEFLKEFQTQFRFVQKSAKWRKSSVEIKLEPPSSRNFATLELLVLSFRYEGEVLKVGYDFQVKKIEASAASIDVKKGKKALFQTFTPDQYRLSNGRINHDLVVASIQEALKEVSAGIQ